MTLSIKPAYNIELSFTFGEFFVEKTKTVDSIEDAMLMHWSFQGTLLQGDEISQKMLDKKAKLVSCITKMSIKELFAFDEFSFKEHSHKEFSSQKES